MSPPSDRPPTLAREIGARAVAIEHALEEMAGEKLESRLHAAEETIARRFGAGALQTLKLTLRVLGWGLVACFFALGLLLLALRYWLLPDIDAMRPRIEAIASAALQAPVSVGRVEASWRGLNLALALNDVRITGQRGTALALPRIEGTLSLWSVPVMEPRFARLRIYAPELEIALLPDGAVSIAGILIKPTGAGGDSAALDWLLRQGELLVRDARVTLRDERGSQHREVMFSDADVLLESGLAGHRFGIRLAPPPAYAAPIDLRGDFRTPPFGSKAEFAKWKGQVYAQVDYIDLAWLNQWLHAPIDVRRASGALRAWLRIDSGELVGGTADLALKDVDARLAPDLQPLQLSSFQGRISQTRWGSDAGGGQQISLAGVTFVLANGAQFAPLDLNFRSTAASTERPAQYELDGSRIDLASLAGIATHVPLGKSLRETIARYAPAGQLGDISMRWEGPEPEWATMTAKARFEKLSIAAQPAAAEGATGTPGFERLTGSVQLDRGSGTLKLASRDVALVLPGVFQEPRIALDQLQADIKWKSGARLDVRIDSLRLANADIDVSASGTWRDSEGTASGMADLNGRISRLEARRAYRYVPLVAGEGTVWWLQNAILDGRVEDGAFRLRGDLSKFPFPSAVDGEFRVAAQLRNGVVDVSPQIGPGGERAPAPVWPLIRDIDAELVFERQGMVIRAQRGTLNGVRIVEASARIPDLGHDATLAVNGQVTGALGDMLGYVNASPVAGWIADITRGAEARGNARLDLRLDIPLLHAADTRASGTLLLQNNDLTLADVPPFSRASGAFAFNERGIRFNNLTAGFLGGQARLDATTRTDGTIAITATGTATPPGLKRALDIDVVQRVLDRAQGSARYTASLTTQPGGMVIVAESDLVGLAIDGIAPLRKSAAEAMPFRIERSSRSGDEKLKVAAARVFGLEMQHRREHGVSRLTRGVIAVNEPANVPDDGMLLLVNVPRLDVEAWAAWLGLDLDGTSARSVAASDNGFRVDHFALRTPDLVIARRSFRNVTLGASRTEAGGYDANVVSEGIVGYIGWRPGAPGATGGASLGQISARLSKLIIPSSKKDDLVGVLQAPARPYPAFEVAIEHFELGPTKYGRLEFSAQNSGTGAAAAWRLTRLEVSNPDMKVTASGDWSPGASGARRMQIAFTLDTSDAGATLARFGIPGAVARGHGKLDGKLDWAGSPLDLDYATLNGNLSLRVEDGRFLKVDSRGAGRLLTLLSLQSLSRTLLTDTRESFGEGFSFATIKADATVSRGIMSTENFTMTGAGAAAFISGSVDLRNETQQLHLVVLPEIDASTAALALGVANPILGLGALLANTVLRAPLSKAFALDYDITGTWNEPIIVRRSRVASTPTESVR